MILKIKYLVRRHYLYAETASPFNGINVIDSLNRDLFKFQSWCLTGEMKINPHKTQSPLIYLGHPINLIRH